MRMKKSKKLMAIILSITVVCSLTGCSKKEQIGDSASSEEVEEVQDTQTENESSTVGDTVALTDYVQDSEKLTINDTAWNYDADHDVYWQIGVGYCADPETTDYETMGIYVPGAYMEATENQDGTYTCKVKDEGTVGQYTAKTAPIVFPVNTAGYSAQAAPTAYSYDGIADYLEAGFVYVYAGMRGRNNGYDDNNQLTYSGGAPWGVTDLKAAIRYYRYNNSMLPGNTEEIYTFGHSGGGAQSAVTGATGDSELYYTYLTSIGAAMFDTEGNYISDAISGAMCWCPITSLDYADEAYEWNMGQYSEDGTRADSTWTSALSNDLADAYATYINELGLKDEQGNTLTLEETKEGIYTAGSYYDYLKGVIETSLNNFLSDMTFPYTKSAGMIKGDGGFGGAGTDGKGGENVAAGGMPGNGEMPSGDVPSGNAPSGDAPSGDAPSGDVPSGDTPSGDVPSGDTQSGTTAEGTTSTTESKDSTTTNDKKAGNGAGAGNRQDATSGSSEETTYATAQEYIDSLNEDETWITYDEKTNTASITSIEAFVQHCKTASKSVAVFDDLNLGQAENMLFGNDESDAAHFDSILANLLKSNEETYAEFTDYSSDYSKAYEEAMSAVDRFGATVEERANMYNPMYYLSEYYEGYQTSNVATHWRIHTGIEQGDTALTVETNLALALEQYEGVEDVNFETVWGQGHTTAERTGSSTENFIQWVADCVNS